MLVAVLHGLMSRRSSSSLIGAVTQACDLRLATFPWPASLVLARTRFKGASALAPAMS